MHEGNKYKKNMMKELNLRTKYIKEQIKKVFVNFKTLKGTYNESDVGGPNLHISKITMSNKYKRIK